MRHAAKIKRCSSEGCKNVPLNGGVCIALLPLSSRKIRSVPRRRYGDMDWQSPSSSCASEGESGMMLLADTALSLSNRDKAAKFFDSSSYLASKNQEVHNIGDVGYTFRKKFHAGWFTGIVTKIRPGAQFDKDRRCIYEDGDEEDLSFKDLKILAALEKLDDRQQRMKDPSDKLDRIQKKKRVSLKVDKREDKSHPNHQYQSTARRSVHQAWDKDQNETMQQCKNVAVRGGIKSSEEECAKDMGQRSNDAAVKDSQIKLKKEECASGMGQRSNDAAVKDAQIKLKKEECAKDMGQR